MCSHKVDSSIQSTVQNKRPGHIYSPVRASWPDLPTGHCIVRSGGHVERLGPPRDAAHSGQLIDSIWSGWHGAPSEALAAAAPPHSAASQASSSCSTPRQSSHYLFSRMRPATGLRLQSPAADAVSVEITPLSAPAALVDDGGARGGPLVGDSWHWNVSSPHVTAPSALAGANVSQAGRASHSPPLLSARTE